MTGSLLRHLMRFSVRKLAVEWAAALERPAEAQAVRLAAILARHADAAVGRRNAFELLRDPDAYRRALPIRSYEDFRPEIDRMRAGEPGVLVDEPVELFAVTSGTTGAPKYVPVTRSMNLEQHRSHRWWMAGLVADHPAVTSGKLFTIVSPAEEGRTDGGVPVGSASGKNYRNQPVPVRRMHAAPYEAFCIADYEARHYALLAFALAADVTCVTSVNPSTLVLLAERMRRDGADLLADLRDSRGWTGRGSLARCPRLDPAERARLERLLRPSRRRVAHLERVLARDGVLTPQAAWPRLACLCTWHGGNAPFYLGRLAADWGPAPTRCLGLRASEGMFSIPLADRTPEGVLAVWGHFLEFLPEEGEPTPTAETLLAHELERGRRYRLIITTSGGLYRYDLGDIVEVTGLRGRAPVVAFLHKAGQVLSVTGEKVTEAQAVAAGKRALRPAPAGFTVTLALAQTPRYRVSVEWAAADAPRDDDARAALAEAFDQALSRENVEYAAKRKSGRLDPPELELLPPGSYAAWRRAQVAAGRPDGQIKPPHLLRDPAALDAIRSAADPDA
ncbi:MAG: GH3 auxin-responsive promoter family protein [Planctomycetota bacterium]